MYLYRFTIQQKQNGKIIPTLHFKFCRYPKKTKLYKTLLTMLDNNEIESFEYSAYNTGIEHYKTITKKQ